MRIDASGLDFRKLNEKVHAQVHRGAKKIVLENVNGQRYIGCGLISQVAIDVHGVPGNDLAAFMDGPTINVWGNVQDATANTMNSGKVVVHGSAGDVLGYAMRGGKVYVEGDVGYRVGIHMKSYKKNVPVIVAGGTAGDFFGEYMAGGIMILLGLYRGEKPLVGEWVGTGMHGGKIFLRGRVEDWQLGREVKAFEASEADLKEIKPYLNEYCKHFKKDVKEILSQKFTKLMPYSHRPYGRVYSY